MRRSCGSLGGLRLGDTARGDEGREALLRVFLFEAVRLFRCRGLEVIATVALDLAPLGDVVVHRLAAGLLGGAVDRDLEAWMEDDLARPAAILGDDLRGDVAPPDDRQRAGHQGRSPAATVLAPRARATDPRGRRSRMLIARAGTTEIRLVTSPLLVARAKTAALAL